MTHGMQSRTRHKQGWEVHMLTHSHMHICIALQTHVQTHNIILLEIWPNTSTLSHTDTQTTLGWQMAPACVPKHSPGAWLPLSGYQHAGNRVSERGNDWVVFLSCLLSGEFSPTMNKRLVGETQHELLCLKRGKTALVKANGSSILLSHLCFLGVSWQIVQNLYSFTLHTQRLGTFTNCCFVFAFLLEFVPFYFTSIIVFFPFKCWKKRQFRANLPEQTCKTKTQISQCFPSDTLQSVAFTSLAQFCTNWLEQRSVDIVFPQMLN